MVATTEEVLELHGRVRECTACPLHLTRTQAVPGYGPVTARVMAVGEAPGENEDREGKPFVGAAGLRHQNPDTTPMPGVNGSTFLM